MKKSAYSEQREMIVAEAINPIATELRLLDPADLISLLRFECYGSIADLVSSAAELYYHPGTINFGAGGEYKLEWEGAPEIVLDLLSARERAQEPFAHVELHVNDGDARNDEEVSLRARCAVAVTFEPRV